MNSKTVLFIFFFLMNHLIIFSQKYHDVEYISLDTTFRKVKVVAYWKNKEEKNYRFTLKENKFQADTFHSERVIYDHKMKFIVIDSTEKSYKIKWDFVEDLKPTLKKNDLVESDEFRNIATHYNDLELIYSTDEWGTDVKFDDLPKLDKLFGELAILLKKQILDTMDNYSNNERNLMKNRLDLLANKDQLLSKMFINPINHFHNLFEYSCHLNDTLSFKYDSPNGINGNQITSDGLLWVESLDSLNEIQFIQRLYPDEEVLNKLTYDYLKQNVASDSKDLKEIKEMEKTTRYSTNDQNKYFIDLNTGFPTYIRNSRESGTTNIETGKYTVLKQDVLIIELLE